MTELTQTTIQNETQSNQESEYTPLYLFLDSGISTAAIAYLIDDGKLRWLDDFGRIVTVSENQRSNALNSLAKYQRVKDGTAEYLGAEWETFWHDWDQLGELGTFDHPLIRARLLSDEPIDESDLEELIITKKDEIRHEVILAVIKALNFNPQEIPDGGRARIKEICLTRPRCFADSTFDDAWKKGRKKSLFAMKNLEKFAKGRR